MAPVLELDFVGTGHQAAQRILTVVISGGRAPRVPPRPIPVQRRDGDSSHRRLRGRSRDPARQPAARPQGGVNAREPVARCQSELGGRIPRLGVIVELAQIRILVIHKLDNIRAGRQPANGVLPIVVGIALEIHAHAVPAADNDGDIRQRCYAIFRGDRAGNPGGQPQRGVNARNILAGGHWNVGAIVQRVALRIHLRQIGFVVIVKLQAVGAGAQALDGEHAVLRGGAGADPVPIVVGVHIGGHRDSARRCLAVRAGQHARNGGALG
ncbi:MAG: hypothetical protein BWX54_00556 [Verrucomicrobia bacterium ADurb.Bin018]|nr:MAG: hypothetical protein BWX54_00556 [Verrucomicrobia bacterium ADurb.Bin018]